MIHLHPLSPPQTIPPHIRRPMDNLKAPATRSEVEVVQLLNTIMGQNEKRKNFIGQGYHGTVVPAMILRNFYENPAWYTAYTPYQAEISQGRLESLVNYQTLVAELTGCDIANASLLDEGTAAAEALGMILRIVNRKAKTLFFVSDTVHPQTVEVVKTRAKYMNVDVVVGKTAELCAEYVHTSNKGMKLVDRRLQRDDVLGGILVS